MIPVNDFKRSSKRWQSHVFGVGIVVATKEAILFTSKPPLFEGKVVDVSMHGVTIKLDVVACEHILSEEV